jgi:acyl carrier protein
MSTAVPGTTDTRRRVVDAIASALAQVLDRPLPELTEDSKLFDELGLDSTGVLEMLMLMEEALGTEFESEGFQMSDFHTVGALADFVTADLAD